MIRAISEKDRVHQPTKEASGNGEHVLQSPHNLSTKNTLQEDDEGHRDHDGEVEVFQDDEPDTPLTADDPLKFRFTWKKLWKFAGPGWLMSLAYLDPGNLESDLQQGAYTRNQIIWVLWWATVMGLILQEMSARLGLVTGRDLAQTVRAGYPRWLNYVIYVNMEIAVIGADIQEVVGTGISIYLITGGAVPVWAGCLITAFDTLSFLAIQYLGVRYLEAIIVTLVSTMTICFFINWGAAGGSDAGDLIKGWVAPTAPSWGTSQAVGTIGAVIMPHNLYLHSGIVLSRKVPRNKPRQVYDAIWYMRLESAGALLVSFFINLALVAVNAILFFDTTCAEISDGPYACMAKEAYEEARLAQPGDPPPVACNVDGDVGSGADASHVCGDFGLLSEAYAMKYALGDWTLYMWAIGLFSAGQAATMVCTYAGQIIMGGCFEIKLSPWVRVAVTRIFALGPALAVAIGTYNNQKLFNQINEYLNILQSVQLPFAMLPVLHFSAQQHLLGRFRSGLGLSIVSTLLAILVMAVNIVLVVQFLEDFSTAGVVVVLIYGCFYFFVCFYMVWDEVKGIASLPGRIYRGELKKPAELNDAVGKEGAIELRKSDQSI